MSVIFSFEALRNLVFRVITMTDAKRKEYFVVFHEQSNFNSMHYLSRTDYGKKSSSGEHITATGNRKAPKE